MLVWTVESDGHYAGMLKAEANGVTYEIRTESKHGYGSLTEIYGIEHEDGSYEIQEVSHEIDDIRGGMDYAEMLAAKGTFIPSDGNPPF